MGAVNLMVGLQGLRPVHNFVPTISNLILPEPLTEGARVWFLCQIICSIYGIKHTHCELN